MGITTIHALIDKDDGYSMLQNLRKHVQGWIAGLIASILCLAFALWGVEYYLGNTTNKVVIAKVDGEPITKNQWDSAYNRAIQSQRIPISDPATSEIFQAQLKQQVLQGLIQKVVLRKAAEKAGYTMSPAQVGASLEKMPAFQLNRHFSYDLFLRALEGLSYTPAAFLAEMSTSNLLQQVQQSISDSNFMLPGDLINLELLEGQKRNFGYFEIPTHLFLNRMSLTEQQIQDYYKANSVSFMAPEQVRIQYILLSTNDIAKQVTLTDKVLRQQKIEQLTAQASDELSRLTYTHPDTLQPAANALGLSVQVTPFFDRNGHQFLSTYTDQSNEPLSNHTSTPLSSENQGKLGHTQRLEQRSKARAFLSDLLTNPKVLSAAFSDNVLKQQNNSDVISIDDHTILVLRLLANKPTAPKPLAEVRKTLIEPKLKQQAADKAVADLGGEIFQKMQRGESIQDLAKQYKITWVKKENMGRTDTDKQTSRELLNFVFNQPAPNRGKDVIRVKKLMDGTYVIFAITQVSSGLLGAKNAAQRELLSSQMKHDFGQLDADLYLDQHLSQAKIQLSPSSSVRKDAVGG